MKFKYGDKVRINGIRFYSNSIGTIVGVDEQKENEELMTRYYVQLPYSRHPVPFYESYLELIQETS